jgi:hypothetical protein
MSAPADDQAMLERNYGKVVPANAASATKIFHFHTAGLELFG